MICFIQGTKETPKKRILETAEYCESGPRTCHLGSLSSGEEKYKAEAKTPLINIDFVHACNFLLF